MPWRRSAITARWNDNAHVGLDVADFTTAQDAAKDDGAHRADHLQRAVTIYRDDLLPGLFDEWILAEREELAQQYLHALEKLIALHADARNYAAAIESAQQLLRYDLLYETGYLRLMELCATQNQRARALHTYHTCATVLERELGITPGAEIQELYE